MDKQVPLQDGPLSPSNEEAAGQDRMHALYALSQVFEPHPRHSHLPLSKLLPSAIVPKRQHYLQKTTPTESVAKIMFIKP